ncbi:MAG: pyridoxal phosphate-dependent aminotransferase [bacterium]
MVLKPLPLSDMCRRLLGPSDDVWQIHYDALARARRGEDVVLMSVGDPDFDTPEEIIETLVSRIRQGRTHYSPAEGELGLRQAIADLETQGTGRTFTPENFVVLPGATAAIYASLACVCNPGDEVVIPEPMYIGYRPMLSALGLTPRTVALDLDNDCALDPEAILAQVTAHTKAVLINTPGNPFGNIVPRQTLATLAEALRARGVWLICDEVYSLFTFDEPHVSLLKAAAELDNVVVVDGLSKSHAMTGWRVGWVASPASLTRAITAYSGSAFFGCSQFIQDAAAFALVHHGPHVDDMREAYRQRRDYVLARLDSLPQLSYVRPKAGMFVMMDIRRVSNSGKVFAQELLAAQGVSVIPGEGFGQVAKDFVRLSLTHKKNMLAEAMDRIERFVTRSA